MFLGIDVGGTFTDAVIVAGGKVMCQAKRPTTHENIMTGLLSALDTVLTALPDKSLIRRATLSTTLITNAVTADKLPEVFLAVMPGPGVNCLDIFPVKPCIIPGYVDHRGEVAAPPVFDGLPDLSGCRLAAVSGKFSVRNGANESVLADTISSRGVKNVVSGREMSGELGFVRRTNSAYYTAAAWPLLEDFSSAVEAAFKARGVSAPVYILKADGGTMPLSWIQKHAAEAFFTGPAASVLGVKALAAPKGRAISLDIGGTTTDIALWEEGFPVLNRRGAFINGYPTAVRALHLRSIALGGDSLIERVGGAFHIGPERLGPAMALGGPRPTLTDAVLTLGQSSFGDPIQASRAMEQLANRGESADAVAEQVLKTAMEKLARAIDDMLAEWALRPVYRVGDVAASRAFEPGVLIGVGGAAHGLAPRLGALFNIPVKIPPAALVANAVGAAVSRPVIVGNLRANTALGRLHIPQSGSTLKIDRRFDLAAAKEYLTAWLKDEADRQGVPFSGAQVIWQEEFPVVRDSCRSGVIIDLCMQLSAGVFYAVEGGGRA